MKSRITKTVALEAAGKGVTCNAICPGYVYTPLVEAQIEGQAKSHGIPREQVVRNVLLAQQPNKRFGTVEEIGAIAARHGFRLSGFRSFERVVTDAQIAAVRERARRA